jgi:selenocysteine-specific elongation factor
VVEEAGPGRAALNVTGDAVAELERGRVLTTDATVVASDRLLVALRGPAGRPAPADRTRVTVHLGTARAAAVVGRSGRDAAGLPDGEATAILRLERPIAVAPGDRFALRRPSPAATLGGGRVLDVDPPRGVERRRTTPERLTALAVARTRSEAWAAARLELHGAVHGAAPALAGDVARAVDGAILAAAAERGEIRRSDLVRAGAAALRREVGPRRESDDLVSGRIEILVAESRLVRDGVRFRPPGAASPAVDPGVVAAMDRLVDALSTSSPPPLAAAARNVDCPPAGVRELERTGRIVRVDDDLAWAAATWQELAGRALAMAAVAPLTPAAFRDASGTSRKYVLALLEDLDRRAILRRGPDGHVPGPRAAQLGAAEPQAAG